MTPSPTISIGGWLDELGNPPGRRAAQALQDGSPTIDVSGLVTNHAVLIRLTGDSIGWMAATYKMSSWRSSGIWHMVNHPVWGQWWVPDKHMRCPHTELKKWIMNSPGRNTNSTTT